MSTVAIFGFALIAAALIALLRRYKPEFAFPVSVAAAAIVLIYAVSQSAAIMDVVNTITQKAGVAPENIKILFKAMGICYITQLAKDTCCDSGETALGEKVELAGKIGIAVLSLPILAEILTLITELML